MADRSEVLSSLLSRIRRLEGEVAAARMREIRRSSFGDLCSRYSALALEAGEATGTPFPAREPGREDFGYSMGIVRPAAVADLAGLAGDLKSAVARALEACSNAAGAMPCWKIGRPCGLYREINPKKYEIFFAFPFRTPPTSKNLIDIICAWLADNMGISRERVFRADSHSESRDFACQICRGIQESSVVFADVTGLNANVHCELGMAFGLGKPVIIVRDELREPANAEKTGEPPILNGLATDIQSLRYIPYGGSNIVSDPSCREAFLKRFAESFASARNNA